MAVEIVRCPGCGGECDEHYVSAANAFLFPSKLHPPHEERIRLLVRQVYNLGKCALSEDQVKDNLKEITDLRKKYNG